MSPITLIAALTGSNFLWEATKGKRDWSQAIARSIIDAVLVIVVYGIAPLIS